MSTLFLHIGTPKTGSTSIQNYLILNKKKLLDSNYYFYGYEDNHGNFASLAYLFSDHKNISYIETNHKLDTYQKKSSYRENVKKEFLAVIEDFPNHNFIISSEQLFMICDDELALKNLYEFLKPLFDNIKIIVYLRRQLEYVLSGISTEINTSYLYGYNQGLKNVLSSKKLSSPKGSKDLYYMNSLKYFIKYFGKHNIHLEYYDKNNNGSGELFNSFNSYLDITNTSNYIKPERRNISSSLLLMKYKIYLNGLLKDHYISPSLQFTNINFKNYSFKSMINNHLADLASNNNQQLLPYIGLHKIWHEEFIESNTELENMFNSIKGKFSNSSIFEIISPLKNYYHHYSYMKQFDIKLNPSEKEKLNELLKLILHFQDFYKKNIDLITKVKNLSSLVKPLYQGHIKILQSNGYYYDGWVKKNLNLIYINSKPITKITLKIFNPLGLNGSITVFHDKREFLFKINDNNHSLTIECYKLYNGESSIKIESDLDSKNDNDKRELSYVLKEIIFN